MAKILRRFKPVSVIAVNCCLNRQGHPVWQRNYYEHIIRDEHTYQSITEYICVNLQQWQEDTYYAAAELGCSVQDEWN